MALATYKVLERSYINNRIYEEGETVELDIKYDEVTCANIEPLIKPTRAKRNPVEKPAELTGTDSTDETATDLDSGIDE